VAVDLRRSPFHVRFHDSRPSWATTFLRRALEADPRFEVAGTTFSSRAISVQTGNPMPLGDPDLDASEVVIVGGLDQLTFADAHALERFMRERGGAIVVVPDQRIDAGAARDLLGGTETAERLLEQPASLVVTRGGVPLQASELLVLRAGPGGETLARLPGADASPVIVTMPRGDGRLLFSGAMDAWRFRGTDDRAFDRFWQSTIAGLAMGVPPAVDVHVDPPLLRPGERGNVVVRVRASGAAVSASIDGDPIRLIPDPEAGVFRGRFTAGNASDRSTITVNAAVPDPRGAGSRSLGASRTLVVHRDVDRLAMPALPRLSMLADSHRGIDVTPARIAELERFVRANVVPPRTSQVRHPMRSAWWFFPFAACLSAEWWLRRRTGLR
jgi:hypothetical protein